MAHSDKDIVITPNKGSSVSDPQIVFSGADASTGPQNITLKILPSNSGTLSIEGSAGQLLSVTNSLTGVIFTVNDVSGIPSIEVNSSGLIKFAQYGGNVVIGGASEISSGKLSVYAGGASAVSWGTGFNLGSAANYTSQIQDASVARWRNVGAGGYQWYNGAGSAVRMTLSDTGNLSISGEITATRLVDADNGNFYLDPAGTSVLNIVNILGGTTRDTFGPERKYYLGNLTASATQAREFEIARVYIDFNDWHGAGTIFVELQNQYYFGGDTQVWSISYDYNNVNCDLISGNSPRGRLARVRCSAPSQSGGLTGDFFYIGIFVDVRYYGQYYTYLRTSWEEATTHTNQSGRILVYTSPSPNNITDFTVSNNIFTNNNIQTSGQMHADLFQEYGDTGRYLNPAGDSVLGKITINDGSTTGGLYVNGATYAVVAVNRANVTDGDAAYLWRTTNSTRWNNRLAINDNNILRWQNAAGNDVLTLSQTGALIASAEMQAPIFYDKDDTTYYVDVAAGAPSNPPGISALLRGHILQQTLLSRPYVVWGASAVSTGQVIIRFPGTIANYGMVHAVIDIYEYSGNNVATAIIGGHNWNNGIWYNFGCNLIGFTDKQIRLGVIGNQFCISIGSNGSTWNYGQVVLRKIQNGSYYSGVMNLGGTYTISQDSNAEASYTYISGDLRQLRSAGSFTTTGYIYGQRFVDYDNNSYYVDPASGSVLAGSITKDGRTVPWVAMQDTAPTATQTGDLWWESDTGRMKLWYNDGNSSQWVDSHPIPDLTGYLKTIGGSLTGPLVSSSYISAEGYIHSNTSIRSERYTDAAGNFLFRVARNSGVNRIINLADTNSDPSAVGNSVNGISWGQRGDNSPYYLIHVRNGENYNGNLSKLTIAWHTGIHIGADPYYGGTNFYSQSPGVGGSLIFSVGRGDSNVRVTNDLYAKSFIDIDSNSYLVNPASDRTTNIYGFTAFTVEGTKGTYKYNTPRWAHTSDQNYWVGSMGWGTNNLDNVFDWGSGFADSWGSPGGAPGDTSHYVLAQAVHYTNGTNRYGWQLAGGVTDSFWWRKTWNGFSSWYRIAMYGNNNSTGWLYAGRFVDSDNTAFFADPASISSMYLINGKLYTNTSDYAGTENYSIKTWTGVLCAGSDVGGAQPYTFVRTKVRYDSYMMGGVTIDWYENYGQTNAKTQICLGGYWNPPGNGGMIGFEYTSTNPNIRPTIVVGYDAQGYTCFRLTHYNSNHVQIVVRDLYLGYSGGNDQMGDSNWQGFANGWQLIQTGDANYNSFAGQVTVQPRLAVAMDSVSLMTAAIGRGSHMGGFLQGSYDSVGNNYSRSNPIYTIGSNYNPNESNILNMYGIGYSGASFGSIAHRTDWGMYVAADGDIRVWLDGSAGKVIGTGNFYADYFYDYYDTNYYVNPQATTQLSAVFANDWFRPQGATGVYWQSYDTRIFSDNSAYLKTRSDYGFQIFDRSANSKGYLYHDPSYNFGLLNYAGSWQVRVNNGYQELYGDTYTNTNYGRIYYWRDDTYYRLYLTSESRMNQLRMVNSTPFYFSGTGEQNFIRDGASGSVTFNLQESGSTSDSDNYGVLYITRTNHNNGHNSGANLYFRTKGSNGTLYEWAGIGGLQTSAGAYSGRLNFYIYYRNNIAWLDGTGMYAPVFFDSQDSFYKFDGAGDTSMNEAYAQGWFRNRVSGRGLYNQATGHHWYSTDAYWNLGNSGYSYGGIRIRNSYEGAQQGLLYYDSSGFGLLNSSGNWGLRLEPGNNNMELYRITYANDVRAYTYYHRGSEGYYLQPASFSNLWRPTAETQQRWGIPWRAMDGNAHRPNYAGVDYWTTTVGWGTNHGTWATYWQYGFAGFDCWGTGTDHPQGSGYVHAQGIQSGLHYANSNGSSAYGWQMVGAADANNRWWLRGKWGGSTRPWYEIALYDNNSSVGNLYADYFYDRDTNYYVNGSSWSRLWGVGSFYLRNLYDVSTDHPYGMYMSEGLSTAYAVYRESGAWNYPYPDLRLAFHTGIKFGANPSYEGMRFYTDYDMSSMIFQVNGGSNYLYKYVWMYTNTTGMYSDTNGWHIEPNTLSAYGSMRIRGNRSGWYGLVIDDGSGYYNHLMYESGNGGLYNQNAGRWLLYHNYSNNCSGFGTSTTSASYGIYVVKGIYSEGNVVAYSDRRAKENISTITNALDKVEKMRGVCFNYKTTPDKKDVGVIAQEMLEAVPEVVDYDKDNDKYSVAYGNLTAVLIEAVKELSAEVKRLKKKLGE